MKNDQKDISSNSNNSRNTLEQPGRSHAAFERLEPCAVKVARTVLMGAGAPVTVPAYQALKGVIRNQSSVIRQASVIAVMCLAPVSNLAEPSSFFEKHAEGWHWYEDPEKKEKVKEEKTKKKEKLEIQKPSPSISQNPTKVIEEQRRELETKLHTAIVEPTRENLIAYITFQKKIFDQSERFSKTWKEVVMTTPSLDETLQHPVDQNARHVYYDLKNKDIKNRIKELSKEYGLFFFFKKDCSYCHRFAPIVKHFAASHGWSLLAVSLDAGTLPEFPEAKRDNGIAKRLKIGHVPALIALHPKTQKLIPLAYGMISESEIEKRALLLTQFSTKINQESFQ